MSKVMKDMCNRLAQACMQTLFAQFERVAPVRLPTRLVPAFVVALALSLPSPTFAQDDGEQTLEAPDSSSPEATVLEQPVASPDILGLPEIMAAHPLAPANTSSPRATLKTFIDAIDEAYRIYRTEGMSRKNRPQMLSLGDVILETLDLSEVPPTQARGVGIQTMALIKEVLDRIELPPPEAIPDAETMRALEEAGEPARWSVPYTEITIARVAEGPRQGQYLFTAKTVERAGQFYQRIKHLPYKPGGVSRGLYDIIRYAPGWMIPEQWILTLPAWMRAGVLEVAVWQWMLTITVLALGGVLLWLLSLGTRRMRRRSTAPWHWSTLVLALATMAALTMLHDFIDDQIGVSGPVATIIITGLWILYLTAGGVAVYTIGNGVAAGLTTSRRIKPESLDANFTRVSIRIISLLVIFYIAVAGAQHLGVPLAPLLAGIGVGGLAVALAARPTLENVIGGFTLFADKPVRVGDFCRFGNNRLGTVEEIGLRSTRIRTLDRSVVSVPNSQFSELQLENLTLRDRIRLHAVLQLRYETTPEQLRYVLAKLHELAVAHPKISNDPPLRVRFMGFGEYSLDVEVFIYVATNDWDEFLAVREDMFLRMMDIIKEAGTSFAIPAQTTYLTRDKQKDTEQVQAAEAEVSTWRSEGKLPFPDLPAERTQKIRDTLEFPPAGSPEGPPAGPREVQTSHASKNPTSGKK
jgi:MscS family membrane protein